MGFFKLLAEAQAEMENPLKTKTGQVGHLKYKYAELPDVLDNIKPHLNQRGIFLTQKTEERGSRLVVQTVVYSDEQELLLDEEPYEYDTNPQEFGKRETYARRYSLLKAFGLCGDEDTDGNVKKTQAPNQQPKKQPDLKSRTLARVAELRMQLIEKGVSNDSLDKSFKEYYKVDGPSELEIEKLNEYGKQLRQALEGMA